MSDFEEFCKSLGVSLHRGPAAVAYTEANDIEELQIAAGEHLCLHAVGIMQALPLPRHGSLVLRGMRKLSPHKWRNYWRLNNDAFCACALTDLCSVRHFFKEAHRWPELSDLLDQSFIMASVYLSHTIKMDGEERSLLQDQATTHLVDFQDHPDRTPQEQISIVMQIEGIEKPQIKKSSFIHQAIVQPSRLEPFFLLQEYRQNYQGPTRRSRQRRSAPRLTFDVRQTEGHASVVDYGELPMNDAVKF